MCVIGEDMPFLRDRHEVFVAVTFIREEPWRALNFHTLCPSPRCGADNELWLDSCSHAAMQPCVHSPQAPLKAVRSVLHEVGTWPVGTMISQKARSSHCGQS